MLQYSSLKKRGKYFKTALILVIIIAIIFVVIATAFSIMNDSKDREQRIKMLEALQVNKTANAFATTMQDVVTVSTFLSTADFDVKLTYDPSINYNEYMDVAEQINAYITLFPQISEISIGTDNGFFSSNSANKYFPQLSDNVQGIATIDNVDIYLLSENSAYDMLVFKVDSEKNAGHLKNDVSINGNSIAIGKDILMHEQLRKEYIITEEGIIVSSFDLNKIGENIKDILSLDKFETAERQEFLKNDKNSLLSLRKISAMKLYAVSITQKEYYLGYFETSNLKVILTSLISAVIIFGICIVMLRFAYRPILRILKQISNYQNIELGSNVNEIEYINNRFKQLYENNERLSETTAEIYKELKKWNMAALQAQMCPHFIYNTLDAINWIAYESFNGDNKISKIAKKMAVIMRSSLDLSRVFSEIEEEIEITKKYVDIVDIKNEGKIHVQWEIDERVLHNIIPRLTIQAMIENAITHAFSNIKADNAVNVSIKEISEDIYIKVTDNGDGIEAERLEEIRRNIDIEGSVSGEKNVGLRNINQRCKIVFGQDYGLIINSEVGKGSEFILKIHKETL